LGLKKDPYPTVAQALGRAGHMQYKNVTMFLAAVALRAFFANTARQCDNDN